MEKLLFEKSRSGRKGYTLPNLEVQISIDEDILPEKFIRKSPAELPEVSENEVARHFLRLSHLNYCIEQGLYPLGSCTMKYNPKINEVTASLSGFRDLHPSTREDFVQGALELMYNLGECLKEISGFTGVTLQPAAGSQGEFTGISMIRAYHEARKDYKRTKILIPDAAHGTNPASAAIAGFEILELKSIINI